MEEADKRYYWPDGRLKWGSPIDVGHLILQLQTLDPATKVSSVYFVDTVSGRKARASGLSMSYERWDESGWLDFQRPGPKCLALWTKMRDDNPALNPVPHPPPPADIEPVKKIV